MTNSAITPNGGETDSEYVLRQRFKAERDYLIGTIDAAKAPRLAPAVRKIYQVTTLWAPYDSVVAEALKASDVTPKTIANLLPKLIYHGFLEKRDDGALRRADWPLPDGVTYYGPRR